MRSGTLADTPRFACPRPAGGVQCRVSGEGTQMRDADLVLCAQRAAARLEDAWDRWRALRGPDSGSAGEVSCYVGYSQNEPRGRPRVVVGVDADEAERLAALIDSGCA